MRTTVKSLFAIGLATAALAGAANAQAQKLAVVDSQRLLAEAPQAHKRNGQAQSNSMFLEAFPLLQEQGGTIPLDPDFSRYGRHRRDDEAISSFRTEDLKLC